jgi:outer membrane protein OmpA-like peptidoglycan-associated protein
MTNMRDIQPEAFEFEPESSWGEFETDNGELESDLGEYEYESPFGELEFGSSELDAFGSGEFEGEASFGEFEQVSPFGEFENESAFSEFETGLGDPETTYGELEAFEFEAPVAKKPPPRATPAAALQCPPRMKEIKCPPVGPRPNAIIDYFDFNKAIVKPVCHILLINDIARRIVQSQSSRQPICSLLLVGHADPVGSDRYNLDLGRRRARAVANAICARLKSLKPKLSCPIQFQCASCGEQQAKATPALSRRVEVFLPAPPAPRGCPPFKERIRLHLKILVQPTGPSIPTMIESMRQVYEPAGFLIEVVSCEVLKLPALEELSLQPVRRLPCPTANLHAEQVALFRNRNNVANDEIVIYFLRQTLPGTRGTCVHPVGLPGAVVTSRASQWTLAHEVGHVLGLRHVAIADRLMFRNTGRITNPPPDLIASEIATMGASALTLPC